MKRLLLLVIALMLSTNAIYSQFDIQAYKNYLSSHTDMSKTQLLQEYPAGVFYQDALSNIKQSEYGDSVINAFNLTPYEQSLIDRHGFMVTDRVSYPTFIQGYFALYNKDVPVYISSDAILHAMHYSFNRIFSEIEKKILYRKLDTALKLMKNEVVKLRIEKSPEVYQQALNDLDIYLSVAARQLNNKAQCSFAHNDSLFNLYLDLIKKESYSKIAIFSTTAREVDFSQFKPRGRYTKDIYLEKYFKAMMWLGRTEILISNYENIVDKQKEEDLHRMTILSALVAEAANNSGATRLLHDIEDILELMIGSQDNITVFNCIDALYYLNVSAYDLCDSLNYMSYKEKLKDYSGANQLYHSQILCRDIMAPDQIGSSISFHLLGQRPIIDGFITANVVYDRVMFENNTVKRMVPSTLDVMFTLGNDAALHLLEPEIDRYNYSTNLAALRYLVNSFDKDFWGATSYNLWLNSIRSLNPPLDRQHLPKFMQTAAWWQKTMNTQLASWAELRHDFLLYSKQPYTANYLCSFPYGFVEPVPDFFENVLSFYKKLKTIYIDGNTDHYYNTCISLLEKLKTLSYKSLYNQNYNEEDNAFIEQMIGIKGDLCNPLKPLSMGWYPKFYYEFNETTYFMLLYRNGDIPDDGKPIIADIHTIPYDASNNLVGWVLNVGTGNVNLSVITTETPNGNQRTYCGVVSSYYEFISKDFLRHTNEEWRKMGYEFDKRPKLTNLYMANKLGEEVVKQPISLHSINSSINDRTNFEKDIVNIKCYPNPSKSNVFIDFETSEASSKTLIEVFDILGNSVNVLLNEELPMNSYIINWNATDKNGKRLSKGMYYIKFTINGKPYTQKLAIE